MIDKLVNVFDDLFKSERLQELAQVAQEYKLAYLKRSSFVKQPLQIKGFKLFKSKGAKRFLGILQQDAQDFDGKIRFYDYLNTKDLETTTSSVVEVTCEELFTDYFIIEPKGTLNKMKDFFVADQKIFPKLEKFHANFQISSKTSDAILLLRESALELLNDFPMITCEAEGNHFLFYTRKKQMPVHKIIPTLDFAEEFLRRLCFDLSDDFV